VNSAAEGDKIGGVNSLILLVIVMITMLIFCEYLYSIPEQCIQDSICNHISTEVSLAELLQLVQD